MRQVVEFCEDLYNSGVRSPYLLAFLIDLYQEKCLREPYTDEENIDSLVNKVTELCNSMVVSHDTIRAKYWQYIHNKFKIDLDRKKENGNNFSSKETTPSTTDDSAV